jgi:chemotaxis signal transduction protein
LGGGHDGQTLNITGGSAGASGDERLLIEFELAGESYGVEISTVHEIIRLQTITRVPGVPGVVEGIINLRGVVVPIEFVEAKKAVEQKQLAAKKPAAKKAAAKSTAAVKKPAAKANSKAKKQAAS